MTRKAGSIVASFLSLPLLRVYNYSCFSSKAPYRTGQGIFDTTIGYLQPLNGCWFAINTELIELKV